MDQDGIRGYTVWTLRCPFARRLKTPFRAALWQQVAHDQASRRKLRCRIFAAFLYSYGPLFSQIQSSHAVSPIVGT